MTRARKQNGQGGCWGELTQRVRWAVDASSSTQVREERSSECFGARLTHISIRAEGERNLKVWEKGLARRQGWSRLGSFDCLFQEC